MYRFGNVKAALARRMESLKDPRWTAAMSYLINGMSYFRWHDSGDIQDLNHLLMIVEVAKNTPNTLHWIPTREYGIVAEYVTKFGSFPENMIVRLSATKFNGVAPIELAKKLGVLVSGASATDFNCRAPHQNNACGDCRMCWSKSVFQVNYKKH
jgi:hypothetical protein